MFGALSTNFFVDACNDRNPLFSRIYGLRNTLKGVGEKHRAEKRSLLRMEFSTFLVAMIQVPCQVVRTSRQIVYRLLSWNPWQGVFLRLVERLHCRLLR